MFLDAPGGTGKTFVIKLLLAFVRQKGEIALAVASSGIAATLIPGGRTAHSALKLPLNLARTENPLCNIKKNSGNARLLQQCKLIVWDECTMSHKLAFEALNLTLKDLRGNNRLMGGVTLLLSGDFRQTLPVISRGSLRTRSTRVSSPPSCGHQLRSCTCEQTCELQFWETKLLKSSRPVCCELEMAACRPALKTDFHLFKASAPLYSLCRS